MLKIPIQYSLLAAVFLMICCKSSQSAQQITTTVQLSERLSNIQLTDMKGKPFTLHKLAGKPIFLNFWATWCGPCVSEMKSTEEVYQQFKNDITFLAVSTESLDKIQAFKQKHQLSFEFAQLNISYLDAYVVTLPTTMLINGSGQLVVEDEGMRIWTQYNNLEKLKTLAKR